jgi:fluoroquinolone resistance protein
VVRSFRFHKQTLKGLDFTDADLAGTDFRDSRLLDCSLRNASLRGCRFDGADLRACDLGQITLADAPHLRKAVISKDQAADLLQGVGLIVR